MDENKEPVRKEEQSVIQEQIVPKKKNNWKRRGKALLRIMKDLRYISSQL